MSPIQLKAIRQLLFFSIEEAAGLVAATPEKPNGVHPALWMDWEQGKKRIPEHIEDTLVDLLDFRLAAIETATEKLHGGDEDDDESEYEEEDDEDDQPSLVAIWYEQLDDFMTLPGYTEILWRPQCSVVAELIATFGADAVTFDGDAYDAWLGQRKDSEAMRAQWAASVVGLETDAPEGKPPGRHGSKPRRH